MRYSNDRDDFDDDIFKVGLEQFMDKEEFDAYEFDVRNESLRDKGGDDDYDFEVKSAALAEADDEFEVKTQKTYPLYPDIKQYNESFSTRYGRREWPNKECKYFVMGGTVLGVVIGAVIGSFINSRHGMDVGGFIGFVIGLTGWFIHQNRWFGNDDEDDDEYDKLWK